jgi:hypothetical protein
MAVALVRGLHADVLQAVPERAVPEQAPAERPPPEQNQQLTSWLAARHLHTGLHRPDLGPQSAQ